MSNRLVIKGPKQANKSNIMMKDNSHHSSASKKQQSSIGNVLGMIGEVGLFPGNNEKNSQMISRMKGKQMKNMRAKQAEIYR